MKAIIVRAKKISIITAAAAILIGTIYLLGTPESTTTLLQDTPTVRTIK